MTCDEVQADFDELLAATLSAAREAELREHFSTCVACRQELRFAEDLQDSLVATRPTDEERSAAHDEAAADVLAGIAARAGSPAPTRAPKARKGRLRSEAGSSAPVWGALAVVVAMALGGAFVASRSGTPEPTPNASPLASPSPTPEASAGPSPSRSPSPSATLTPTPSPSQIPSPTPSPTPLVRPSPSESPEPVPSLSPAPEAPMPAPSASPASGTDERGLPGPGEVLAGRVGEVVGRAYVVREGKRLPLSAGDEVQPGEALELGSKALVMCALRSADAKGQARILIGPKSTFSLGQAGGAILTRGSVWVEAEAALRVAAPSEGKPGSVVEVRRGDALLTRKRGGLQVDAVAGAVRLVAPRVLEVPLGSQLFVDVSGAARAPRVRAFRAPRWTQPRPASAGQFLERFLTWPKPYPRTRGQALPIGVRAEPYQGAEEVSFGRSEVEGGLTRVSQRGVLRLRVRVALPTTLTLQVMNHTQVDNFNATQKTQRSGLWTSLEFKLSDLKDNAKQGKQFAAGDLLGYVTLRAAPEAKLELREVRVD